MEDVGGGKPGESEIGNVKGDVKWDSQEIRKSYRTLQGIMQLKKCEEAGANKKLIGIRIKGYGMGNGKFVPLSPPPEMYTHFLTRRNWMISYLWKPSSGKMCHRSIKIQCF